MKSTPPRKGTIMNQNLSSYRIFYTVANTGNISKAAKELYISQPAISKSIQKLEESVGCRLFSRSSRGVVLTDEGQLLYEHVKTAFETLTLGEEKLKRSIELGVGHLKIGVSATLCKYMLLPYLKEFIRQNPHITISIHCQSTNDTLKLLEDDKIDIGLIGKPDNVKNIHFDYLEEIEDIFVATKDYLRNLHARGVRKDEILTSSTLMLLDQNNMTRQYIDDYLQENHIAVSYTHLDVYKRQVLYTVFYKSVIIRHDRPVDVFDDRVGIVGELIHCLRYQRVDGLNIVRGLSGGIRQLSYLIRDNCKSFSGFACSRRLNGSIQCKEVRLAGYA